MYINRIKISLPLTRVNSFTKEWTPAYGYPFQVKNVRFDDGTNKLKGEYLNNASLIDTSFASVNGENQFRFLLTSVAQKLNVTCTCRTSAVSGTTNTNPVYIINGGGSDANEKNATAYYFDGYKKNNTTTSYGIPFVEFLFNDPIDLKGLQLNLGPKFDNSTVETDRDFIFRIESFINEVRRSCNDITKIETDMNIENSIYVEFKDVYTVVKREGKIYYLKPKADADDNNIELLTDWSMQNITDADLHGLVWGNDEFLTVGKFGTIMASKDGINWTDRRLEANNSNIYYADIAWNDTDKIYAMNTASPQSRYIYKSMDGIVWSSLSTYYNSSSTYNYIKGKRCKFIDSYFYNMGISYYNNDGGTSGTQGISFFNKNLKSIGSVGNSSIVGSYYVTNMIKFKSILIWIYASNSFGWVGTNNYEFRTGTAFSYSTGVTGSGGINNTRTDFIDGLAANDTRAIALGYPATTNLPYPNNINVNCFVYISTDGKTWVAKPTNINGRIYDLTVIDNKFYGVGAKGLIISSDDGEKWNIKRLPTQLNLKRLVKHDKTWLAIGDNGLVARYEEK